MSRETSRSRGSSSYVFKFVGTASVLVAGTLVLVLYVLPERYVLSSGFREGNLNLPNPQVPFEPAPPLRIAAVPGIPGPRGEIPPGADPADFVVPRGPAELFWERVGPLLEAERYREAIPLFTDYLSRHPGDLGARREYAITLDAVGEPERAVVIFRELLEYEDDDELHLLLGRTLRDSGRVEEAGEHYSTLLERHPTDEELTLEWAQALSWSGDHDRAEDVVRRALEASPESLALRAEEARIVYYSGRLADADRLLRSFTPEELAAAGLTELRDQVRAELTPPPDTTTPPPPPTLLEQALQAREADDLDGAEALFRSALEEAPDDVEAWRAYADFLQYEREDFLGALEALREVERRTDDPDAALQYRMAQLEIWTEQTDEARLRLESLLAGIDDVEAAAPDSATTATGSPPPTRADVLALLGDLDRWEGERLAAVGRYQDALEADPDHEAANDGLDVLRAEVDRFLVQSEDPGIGAVASTFADTDDFRRYQAGGAWTGLHDAWVWSTVSGGRWVEGYEPGAGLDSRQGLFADLEGGRWWRWGTVRTALHLGIQNVRSNSSPDVGVGASIRFMGSSGSRTDLRFDHEPAAALTNTLQSLTSDVRQDRLLLSHSRPLSQRWTGAVTGEVASLEHGSVASDRNTRMQVGLSAARELSPVFSAGLASRALTYTDPAPSVPLALPDATAVRLYWDPELSVSLGPFLQMVQPLSSTWDLTGRIAPGVAYIRERNLGSEVVPDLSGRLGFLRDGSKYRTRIEFFYGQGRFSRYRSYGVDFSFSARGFLGPGFGS